MSRLGGMESGVAGRERDSGRLSDNFGDRSGKPRPSRAAAWKTNGGRPSWSGDEG